MALFNRKSDKSTMDVKQKQTAGNGGVQIQGATVNVMGITEQRTREVFNEMFQAAIPVLTEEARKTAEKRVHEFEPIFVDAIERTNTIAGLAEPAIQDQLLKAQKVAAISDRPTDYHLLAELLAFRIESNDNRSSATNIDYAVEIVNQISDEGLLALTIIMAVNVFTPKENDSLESALAILNTLYQTLLYDELPKSDEWIDHLDILRAVRVTTFSTMGQWEDYFFEVFDGFTKNGIKKNTDVYTIAVNILADAHICADVLQQDPYSTEYVKLKLMNKAAIDQLGVTFPDGHVRKLTETELSAYKNVYDLYDQTVMDKAKFIGIIQNYESVQTVRTWWNGISNQLIQLTSVGMVLGHTNARRIDPNLPDLK